MQPLVWGTVLLFCGTLSSATPLPKLEDSELEETAETWQYDNPSHQDLEDLLDSLDLEYDYVLKAEYNDDTLFYPDLLYDDNMDELLKDYLTNNDTEEEESSDGEEAKQEEVGQEGEADVQEGKAEVQEGKAEQEEITAENIAVEEYEKEEYEEAVPVYDYIIESDNSEDNEALADSENLTDTLLEYEDENEFGKAAFEIVNKTDYENLVSQRRVFEIVVITGIALTSLIIMFGMVSLLSSLFSSRPLPASLPNQVLASTSGSIIKQYTRLPVEVKNMLPSNVAYKQLYET